MLLPGDKIKPRICRNRNYVAALIAPKLNHEIHCLIAKMRIDKFCTSRAKVWQEILRPKGKFFRSSIQFNSPREAKGRGPRWRRRLRRTE